MARAEMSAGTSNATRNEKRAVSCFARCNSSGGFLSLSLSCDRYYCQYCCVSKSVGNDVTDRARIILIHRYCKRVYFSSFLQFQCYIFFFFFFLFYGESRAYIATQFDDEREKPRIYFRVHFVARRFSRGRAEDESRWHCSAGRGDTTRIISCRIPRSIYPPSRSRVRVRASGRVGVCGTSAQRISRSSACGVHPSSVSDARTRDAFSANCFTFRV